MSDLTTLLERVQKATGPDRVLDAALYDHFCSHATQEFTEWDSRHDFTHSIDTALALVNEMLPGWNVTMATAHGVASVIPMGPDSYGAADERTGHSKRASANMALAILSALIRALIAQSKEPAHGA